MKKRNKVGLASISIYCSQEIELRQWEYSYTCKFPLLWGNGVQSSWIEGSIFHKEKQRDRFIRGLSTVHLYLKLSLKLSAFCEFVLKKKRYWKDRWNGTFLEPIQGKKGPFCSNLGWGISFYPWFWEEYLPGGTINL